MEIKLDNFDLNRVVRFLPSKIKSIMEQEFWRGKIFIAGGFIRDLVAGDKVNDIDLFVNNKAEAELLLSVLQGDKKVISTENAFTICERMPIQIIHRWTFQKPEEVLLSFDFSVCSAAMYYSDNGWEGICHERFYKDVASKRLIYLVPDREEAPGGSMIRILKFYKRGYNIPLNNLSKVVARMMQDAEDCYKHDDVEKSLKMYIDKALFEVDPLAIPMFDDSNKDE